MTKLLIVEDDLLLDEAYRRKFGDKFDVRIATDGETGIKMASAFEPEAILLDIYMAGRFNGIDVLRELKKNQKTAGIPVLVITNMMDAVERVLQMGASKCFMKTEVDLNNIEEELLNVIAKSTM